MVLEDLTPHAGRGQDPLYAFMFTRMYRERAALIHCLLPLTSDIQLYMNTWASLMLLLSLCSLPLALPLAFALLPPSLPPSLYPAGTG